MRSEARNCNTCACFGYWKETTGGRQAVCRYGDNFNFMENRYEDDYALVCKNFKELTRKAPAVQASPVHADEGQ